MNSKARYSYFSFGVRMSSNIPLHWLGPERAGNDHVDVYIDRLDEPVDRMDPGSGDIAYESVLRFGGVPYFTLRRTDAGDLISYLDGVHFLLMRNRIQLYSEEEAPYPTLQSRLLSAVFATWLENHGVMMLHASSVQVGNAAVGFLANSGMGKSTMAAYFVSRGNAMVSDDLLPCRVSPSRAEASPAFPSLRLYPGQVRHFFGATDGIEVAQPYDDKLRMNIGSHGYGHYCGTSPALARLYLLERVDDLEPTVAIHSMDYATAIQQLTLHSFIQRLARATGKTGARFGALAELVNRVPVRRLVYRSGFEFLSTVYDAVSEDVMVSVLA